MELDTRELFARLIKCEAENEGENGMKAVATTVMNRVRVPYGEYFRVNKGDLRKVITQHCQFSCHKSVIAGKVNKRNVWNLRPDSIHHEIAREALKKVFWGVGDKTLWFRNPGKGKSCPDKFPADGAGTIHRKINNHCFYNFTEIYKKT